MEIKKKRWFYIRDSEEMHWVRLHIQFQEDLITVDSTYVSDELRGRVLRKSY